MSSIISGKSLSFDSGIAEKCGIKSAIIFNHICYWIEFNQNNPAAIKENKVWMYAGREKMSEFLKFLSPKEIRNALDILIEYNLIEKRNFNENKMDRTNWYSVVDDLFKKMFTIGPVGPKGWTGGATVYKDNTDKYNDERYVGTVEVVHNSSFSEIKSRSKNENENVQKTTKTDFRNRAIPKFLNIKGLPQEDRQILANCFTESELARAVEDLKSYSIKVRRVENMAAFMTHRCKEYRSKRV